MAKPKVTERVKNCGDFIHNNKYAVYVLTILMLIYMVNQCDTFCLIATNTSMSQDMEYGDRQCSSANDTAVQEYLDKNNSVANITITPDEFCEENYQLCDDNLEYEDHTLCYWNYLGKGLEYQLLAGPLYIVLFSISGIPLGLIAELKNINRKLMLFICVLMWSSMTIFGGLCTEYWQVAITRLLMGIFSAGCVPFSASIISDYFGSETRGAALGFFNWGIYLGYSMTFLLTIAEQELGWESVYFIAGVPGIVLGIVMIVSVKEPVREPGGEVNHINNEAMTQVKGTLGKLKEACKRFADPCLLLLCLGGAIRNGAGFVFAYNVIIFFEEYHPGVNTVEWMSWIPLVFGSIGAFGGGYASDRFARRSGVIGRLLVLIGCLVFSAPFLVGTLFATMPWCWVCLMIAYVIGEMWIGVCVAVVIDMVPAYLTTSSVAVYFFIIQIIGGNMNLLVPPIEEAIGLQYALLIMLPGMYVIAAILFTITLFVHLRKERSTKYKSSDTVVEKIKEDSNSEKSSTYDEYDVMYVQSGDLLKAHDALANAHATIGNNTVESSQL